MPRTRYFCALVIGLASVSGCSDHGITENTSIVPRATSALSPQVNAAASADVDGDWLWTVELALSVPDYVAAGVFGIQPEGPMTRARCAFTGTMTLAQAADAFTGSALITAGECVTRGGQTFVGIVAPEVIEDGRIRGHSLEWRQLVAGGLVACSIHAVITEELAGTATVLEGAGPCFVPGHPRLNDPFDPPPGGTQTILSWTAVRS